MLMVCGALVLVQLGTSTITYYNSVPVSGFQVGWSTPSSIPTIRSGLVCTDCRTGIIGVNVKLAVVARMLSGKSPLQLDIFPMA